MKQILNILYKTFIKFFKKLRFTQLEFDNKIFVLADKKHFIVNYVENFLIFGLDVFYLEDTKHKL